MKNKIRVIIIVILSLLFLWPVNMYACPHIDENGEIHFMFFSDDYSETIRVYPKINHYYSKVTDENEKLLYEEFSFPLVQDKATYFSYYSFVDESLLQDGGLFSDVKTTVEGLNSVNVSGKGYELVVNVKETFNKRKKYINKYTHQLGYNVNVTRLNDNISSLEYEKSKKIINNNKLNLIDQNILKVKSNISVMDNEENNWKKKTININKYYEEIVISINLPNSRLANMDKAKLVVVNLEDSNLYKSIIYGQYDENKQIYTYSISNNGTYVIVENNIEDKESEDIDIKEKSNKRSNVTIYLIIGGLVLMFVLIYSIKKK